MNKVNLRTLPCKKNTILTILVAEPLALAEQLAEARHRHVTDDCVVATQGLSTEDVVRSPVERRAAREAVQAASYSRCVGGDELVLLVGSDSRVVVRAGVLIS
jgi:hypothetical protein